MNLFRPPRRDRALTLIDVIIVLAILAVIAALVLPAFSAAKRDSLRINCVNILKEDGLAVKIWEGDNNDLMPQQLSVTNGGARELLIAGNVAAYFQTMSNELSTPTNLWCRADNEHVSATYFTNLANKNISYFVSLRANDSCPQMVLFGDNNLAEDGVPVKPGMLDLWTNRSIGWTAKRHYPEGNLSFADGSVAQTWNSSRTNVLAQPGNETNQIVIP